MYTITEETKIMQTIGKYTIVKSVEQHYWDDGTRAGRLHNHYDICLDGGEGDIVHSCDKLNNARQWARENCHVAFKPLKTSKGNEIWYSKFGVGKQIGSKFYFHKSVHNKIIPVGVWSKAMEIMNSDEYHDWLWDKHQLVDWEYETICYDLQKPNIIRFDRCMGFDIQNEPTVGWMLFLDINNGNVQTRYNQQIYHHKWLFVKPTYNGFNVQKSYERSKEWLKKLPETASGYKHKWREQLKKYNIFQGGI